MTDPEVWTTPEVAKFCGIKDTVVSNRMIRLGVPVYDREPGRAGRNRYLANLVRDAVAKAPGKGNRTPRKPAPPT
ncbi:hypothetical protein BBK82_03450 [Lentzea guizhouensis]|uniref:DNA-binding protein n=1 Tax=Lentzea guizhouensis TaxID=1586287 RepID=A0A1B2HC13_9PSEU|nr:hypothetical protein [Lentzea guizhouensis]ANZ35271.1 hypothetical protein BBK82_03450 [Lentzea guizhouensis]